MLGPLLATTFSAITKYLEHMQLPAALAGPPLSCCCSDCKLPSAEHCSSSAAAHQPEQSQDPALSCTALCSQQSETVVQEQYLEVTISVAPTIRLFGLGERTQSAGAQLRRDGVPLALWAADRGALFADVNLYGSWPFLLQLAPGGKGGAR